ncbi:MAG TPA: mycofactocin biosynthesis glycosyltransferase MftF [Acidimicrobiales bacterium]
MGALPAGFGLVLDPALRRFRDGTVLAGGRPGRVLTLTPAGARALDAFVAGGEVDEATRSLAGRLVASGMAHPRRPADTVRTIRPRTDACTTAVTVVIPVRDRTDELDGCLASLGRAAPVVVVDDGSRDPEAVAAVCRRHGARMVRRYANGGPGAARATGLVHVTTDLVAFVDSDCTVPDHWLDGLAWHFTDPDVGAVAPRVRPAAVDPYRSCRVAHRFGLAHSPLDLGPDQGEVGPDRAVRYVPTAAVVVRRRALEAVGGFDPALRVGEDVDLVWRLVDAGWRVRYDPSVEVSHREPDGWSDLLARRFRYGTSAAPLAARHPGRLAPVELRPRPTVAALALLAGRPGAAALVVASSAVPLAATVRPLGIPSAQAWRWAASGAGWTVMGIGRAATMLALPGLVGLAASGKRGRRSAIALVLVPPVVDWMRRRPDLDLVRWVAASVADDVAYGAGVWTGSLRARSAAALLPTVVRAADEQLPDTLLKSDESVSDR